VIPNILSTDILNRPSQRAEQTRDLLFSTAPSFEAQLLHLSIMLLNRGGCGIIVLSILLFALERFINGQERGGGDRVTYRRNELAERAASPQFFYYKVSKILI